MLPNPFVDSTSYAWSFFRAGGFDQVKIRNGADIANLERLDPKLWAALGCPTRGLHFDARTLDLMDADHDGRIRVPEIIAAAKWVCSLLKDPDTLLNESESLPLAAITQASEEGQRILASAKQILENLGKPQTDQISVADTTDTTRIFAQTRFNGDGIVPADAADDPDTRAAIIDMIALYGSVTDRSGKPGIDRIKLATFVADLEAYSAWHASAEQGPETWPLGPATESAFIAFDAVAAKIDDFFARTRLAAYDLRAMAALNRHENEYLDLVAGNLSITADEVRTFPLARITPHRSLPLVEDLNPAWIAPIRAFSESVVKPMLGQQTELTEAQYLQIKARFAPYAAWQARKAGAAVESLGLARVRALLQTDIKARIEKLIEQDKALEPQADAIALVDKLVRYHRDLHRLLINFVNFRDFYDKDEDAAIFQAGRLYLDQRSCDLCVRVEDMAKHSTLAPLSRVYLAYCDCVRRGAEKMTIAAAFTAGDSDNLMVGRNGVFYDRAGQDWDATIVRVFENPISIGQAFWSPYKRMIRWVEEQVAKRAAAADTAVTESITTSMAATVDSAGHPIPKPKPRFDVGTIAAMGVAFGAVTATLGALLQTFFGLGMWMPLGIVGIILAISGPSMVIAWLKLRQRNLGPLLDANGWAVNTRARINIPFGATLTAVAKLPPGSRRDLKDPYAESKQKRVWLTLLAVALLAGWVYLLWHKSQPATPPAAPTSQPASQPTT